MPTVDVLRTYVEMTHPGQLRPRRVADPAVRVEDAAPCPTSLYRRLYQDVGHAWHWVDRLPWDDARLAAHLADPAVRIRVLRVREEIAGWYELVRHPDGSVEIAYFGLVGRFIGRGLGAHLLTDAVEEAWRAGATRVWLHTCTLDSPAALPNYRARGFIPFQRETYRAVLPGEAGGATGGGA